jgi:quinol monooxygenase YgiN
MYARIVTVHIKPEDIEAATAIYRDSVVPAAQQQPGNVSMTLLTDRVTGKSLSIGLWTNEADLVASGSNGYLQQQFAKFGAMFTAPPTAEAFEVRVRS